MPDPVSITCLLANEAADAAEDFADVLTRIVAQRPSQDGAVRYAMEALALHPAYAQEAVARMKERRARNLEAT